METRLRIAIQKSGRLSEKSIELLRNCGIKVQKGSRSLITQSKNFPIDILHLRDDDIPQYVHDGTADLGILGENVLIESGFEVPTVKKLGFAKCRLSLAVPKHVDYSGVNYFEGKKIATTYPVLLKKYLDEKGVSATMHEISGSVEIAPNIGLADGICDIVSTGSTLFSNGLKEVEKVMFSEAVLISNNSLSEEKIEILNKLLFRFDAVMSASQNKYLVMNVPNDKVDEVINILPGMKSPTVVPLATEGWSAIHTVIAEDKFWNIIDGLKERGASGILVVPIQKMIM